MTNLLVPTVSISLPQGKKGPKVPKNLRLGWRLVEPDMRSRNGFRWGFPGCWSEAPGPVLDHSDPCPCDVGDGICIAKTWEGARSGGSTSTTAILVAYSVKDLLGEDSIKVRVRKALTLDLFDVRVLVGRNANLRDADLRDANLRDANLWNANLRDANLWNADLRDANLRDANLWNANLRDANLWNADLWNADLRDADHIDTVRVNSATCAPLGWTVCNGHLVKENS